VRTYPRLVAGCCTTILWNRMARPLSAVWPCASTVIGRECGRWSAQKRFMKKLAKHVVDATLVPLMEYVLSRVRIPRNGLVHPTSVVDEVLRRAVADSADYADSRMREALCIRGGKEALWRHAFAARAPAGLIVEFGVFRGQSIRFLASLTGETIYGFDSFEGLQEDWKGWAAAKGTFDMGGIPPPVPANVKLIKGSFQETLSPFLHEHREQFSFVHIDSDTYEAASIILGAATDRFRSGTVVVFDEYFGYRGWRAGESKAWQEFVAAGGIRYRYLAFHDQAVALVVT
jgi:predicted O-methyltransferase YrrM